MKRQQIVLYLLMLAVTVVGCNYSDHRAGNEIVGKVEQIKKSTGRLPETLSDMGFKEDESCPCYCKTGNDSYIVWYGTTLGESNTYNSLTGKWSEANGAVCTPTAQSFHTRLSQAEKQHVLDGPFSVVTKTADMPPSAQQAFATITSESSFRLANPGHKYQATDFVVDRELPRRRLVFAGVHGDGWFVQYEVGGIGHYYCVLLFDVDPKKPLFVWGGAGIDSAKNLDQLRQTVAAGAFSDKVQSW